MFWRILKVFVSVYPCFNIDVYVTHRSHTSGNIVSHQPALWVQHKSAPCYVPRQLQLVWLRIGQCLYAFFAIVISNCSLFQTCLFRMRHSTSEDGWCTYINYSVRRCVGPVASRWIHFSYYRNGSLSVQICIIWWLKMFTAWHILAVIANVPFINVHRRCFRMRRTVCSAQRTKCVTTR